MSLVTKGVRYAAELGFAARVGRSARDKLRLAVQTIRFHLGNGRGWTGPGDTFGVRVRLQALEVDLRLRATGGDLVVFYEVLMDEVYGVPAGRVEPDEVRCVIDCGANVGMSALYFANRYPRAMIYAVEPHPDNFRLLSHNVAGIERVVPIQAAVVGRPRDTVVLSTDLPAWGNSVTDSGVGVTVPAVTIPQLMAAHCLTSVDLLKVDIEGAEREVFTAADFLSATRFVVAELHGDYSLANFDRDVRPFGFAAHLPDVEAGLNTVFAAPTG